MMDTTVDEILKAIGKLDNRAMLQVVMNAARDRFHVVTRVESAEASKKFHVGWQREFGGVRGRQVSGPTSALDMKRDVLLGEALTPAERSEISNGLRIAVKQYERDITTCLVAGTVRAAQQFERQAKACRAIIERMED
jgi:hypothetical protein